MITRKDTVIAFIVAALIYGAAIACIARIDPASLPAPELEERAQ